MLSILLAFIVPGGFLVLLGWMLARAVHGHMEQDTGPAQRRLARALGSIRWPDLVRQARRVF